MVFIADLLQRAWCFSSSRQKIHHRRIPPVSQLALNYESCHQLSEVSSILVNCFSLLTFYCLHFLVCFCESQQGEFFPHEL